MSKIINFEERSSKINKICISRTENTVYITIKKLNIYLRTYPKKNTKNLFKKKKEGLIKISEREFKQILIRNIRLFTNISYTEYENLLNEVVNNLSSNECIEFEMINGNLGKSKEPFTYICSSKYEIV